MPALAPDERRAALIQATIPLLHEHGSTSAPGRSPRRPASPRAPSSASSKTRTSWSRCRRWPRSTRSRPIDALAAIDRRPRLRERLTLAAVQLPARFTEHVELMDAVAQAGAMDAGGLEARTARRPRLRPGPHPGRAGRADRAGRGEAARAPPPVARLLLLSAAPPHDGPFGDPGGFDPRRDRLAAARRMLRQPSDTTTGGFSDGADRLLRYTSAAVPRHDRAGRALPVPPDAGHAVPAHAERRHHRQRRDQGRHRLRDADRRRHARHHAAADRARRSSRSTSAPVPRWRSAGTSGPRSSAGCRRSRPARSASSARRR